MKNGFFFLLSLLLISDGLQAQMFGTPIGLRHVDNLLILNPYVLNIEVEDNHLEKKEIDETERLGMVVNMLLDSLFPSQLVITRTELENPLDTVIHKELKNIAELVKRRKTLKGIHVPKSILAIMEKNKCDFALGMCYERWERSSKNKTKIRSKAKFVHNAMVGQQHAVYLKMGDSYSAWLVFDRQKDQLVISCRKYKMYEEVEEVRELMKAFYQKCFAPSLSDFFQLGQFLIVRIRLLLCPIPNISQRT